MSEKMHGGDGKFKERAMETKKKRQRVRSVDNEKEGEQDRNEECRGK